MGTSINFLVTVLNGDTLLRCAIQLDRTQHNDWYLFPLETESKEILHGLLPLHVQSCGPIVHIERIFEIVIKS